MSVWYLQFEISRSARLAPLTLFGVIAVSLMLITYALETRGHWFVLAFAGSCLFASAHGFLQGAWPFGAVEAFGQSSPLFAGGTELTCR